MKIFVIIFFFALTQLSTAQNLVLNGGFETFNVCPNFYGQIDRATGWVIPNGSSPDYLNRCYPSGAGGVGVPLNAFGNQEPHGGDAYGGIVLLFGSFREYIQTRLLTPLGAGKCYRLEIYVSLAEKSAKYTTDDWGVYFSTLPLSDFQSQEQFTVTPQILNTPGNYPDFLTWKLSTGYFYANGGEEYITIGNFKSYFNTNIVQIKDTVNNDGIYMYVDDISLTACLDAKLHEYQQESGDLVFPTIFKEELKAKIGLGKDAELIIFDNSGQIIARKKFNGNCSIDTETWNSGIYFFQLRTELFVISKGKLIKE